MTREETVKIIRIICDSYPNYKPSNLSETVDVWCMMLSDYTYEQVSVALKAYILSDISGFAPSIGQLVGKIQTISQPQELNEMEAWSLVSRAIRNSTYNSAEEFEKLPPLVQKAVGLPNQLRTWAMDENYNEQVASSNFIKCYRTEVARSQELSKMPSEVIKFIEHANNSSYAALLEEKRQQALQALDSRIIEEKRERLPVSDTIRKKMENMFHEKL